MSKRVQESNLKEESAVAMPKPMVFEPLVHEENSFARGKRSKQPGNLETVCEEEQKEKKSIWQKTHHPLGIQVHKPTCGSGECLCRHQRKQRFVWDQIILRSCILNVKMIECASLSWTRSPLTQDQAIKWSMAIVRIQSYAWEK